MKRIVRTCFALPALLASTACLGAPPVQTAAQPTPPPADAAVALSAPQIPAAAQQEIRMLEAELASISKAMSARRAKLGTAAARDSTLLKMQERFSTLSKSLKLRQESLGRMLPLFRLVSVDMRDATLPQAVQVLSQTSGVPVSLSAQLLRTDRVTVAAQDVPLATVLEAIAGQANLMIAPAQNGVDVRQWPTVQVDDQVRILTGPNAPWSTDWGGRPTAVLQGNGIIDLLQPGQPLPYGELRNGYPYLNPNLNPNQMRTARSSASLTSLGDGRFVVAEPGTGPNREAGLWLTAYRLDGSQLKRISSTFHRTPSAADATRATNDPNKVPVLGDLPLIGRLFRKPQPSNPANGAPAR